MGTLIRQLARNCSASSRKTSILLYDSRTQTKRPLKSLTPGVLTWYQCGPTVYADSHIGHAATYVRFDIIRRVLTGLFNFRVVQAMCITDIDDKIIAAANKQNIHHGVLARKFESEFFSEMDRLNVLRPSITLRVTENIPQVVNFVQKAIDNNYAYLVEDGSVYFDVNAYGSQYNVFTKLQSAVPEAAPVAGKRSPADFALWKNSKPGEPHWTVTWRVNNKSVTVEGRPGWHIECSTLSTLAFGNQFDLHSGGEDLMFPHHQNEIAQCVAAGCVKDPSSWVGHWLHAGHLHMPSSGTDQKMSKSLGNTISISRLLGGGKIVGNSLSPSEFRLLTCLNHYRDRISITPAKINEAKNFWRRVEEFFKTLRAWAADQLSPNVKNTSESELLQMLGQFESKFVEKLADDVDSPSAFEELDSLMSRTNQILNTPCSQQNSSSPVPFSRMVPLAYLEGIGKLLTVVGLPNPDPLLRHQISTNDKDSSNNHELTEALNAAVEFRSSVRRHALTCDSDTKKALMDQCDNFRSQLNNLGIAIKDTGVGKAFWERRNS